MIVHTLTEGRLDTAAARRLIRHAGLEPGEAYGEKGIAYIQRKIGGFNKAAKGSTYLALVDFADLGIDCPPNAHRWLLPKPSPNLLLRLVVGKIESWLLADAENLADFLRVPISRLPTRPEELSDPKADLVRIAHYSRSKAIRSAIAPEEGSTARIGRLYVPELSRFILGCWSIREARKRAPSLDRCVLALQGIGK